MWRGGPLAGVLDGRESLSTGLPAIHHMQQQHAGIAEQRHNIQAGYESTFSTDCACSHHVNIHRIPM
jgi:hypothetical protein